MQVATSLKKSIDSQIQQIADLINQGIEAWYEAGKTIANLVDEHGRQVYVEISEQIPYLGIDVLEAFEKVGRRQLCPQLLLADSSPGLIKLSQLPYEMQLRYHDAEVTVVYRSGDEWLSHSSKVTDLTRKEAELVFTESGIRSVEDQKKILLQQRREREARQKKREAAPPAETKTPTPQHLPAFHRETLKAQAITEILSWRDRYAMFIEFAALFQLIDRFRTKPKSAEEQIPILEKQIESKKAQLRSILRDSPIYSIMSDQIRDLEDKLRRIRNANA